MDLDFASLAAPIFSMDLDFASFGAPIGSINLDFASLGAVPGGPEAGSIQLLAAFPGYPLGGAHVAVKTEDGRIVDVLAAMRTASLGVGSLCCRRSRSTLTS